MRRHTSTAILYTLASVSAVMLAGAAPAGAVGARVAAVPACGGWSVVPSPSPGQSFAQLNGVAAISSTDVWAVGDWYNLNSAALTLVEHWDGTRWSRVPSPSPGGTLFGSASVLSAVTAISASNVWAVGYHTNGPYPPNVTLVEHWDGTRWSVVPSPNMPPPANGQLSGITATSPTNAWAVGYYNDNNIGYLATLIERWDGARWRIVPSPNTGNGVGDNVLNAVAASSGELWAVGSYQNFNANVILTTLAERWDGTQWTIVPSPNRSPIRNALNAVAVAAVNSVWAAGYDGSTQPPPTAGRAVSAAVGAAGSANPSSGQTLTEHWDGTRWTVVPSPSVGTEPVLAATVAISPGNVWAVGQSYRHIGGTDVLETLTEHWDGTRWTVVPSPNVGTSENFLDAVDHVAGTNELWAVGYYANGSSPFPTLIEHYC